jgi:hypothetical protein
MHNLLTLSRELFAAAEITSWMEGVNSSGRVFLIVMVIGALVLVSTFVVMLIDRIHQRNAEMAIKRDLLERGLSVDEVERVLAAKATHVK